MAAAKLEFREPTSSLDPYVFDDELIPFNAMCCMIDSLYLKTPDCFGGHGLGVFLCINQEFTLCKPGRNGDEYVVVQDGLCSIVKPKVCCKGARQCFCCDSRYSFLDFETKAPLDPNFPCLLTCMGLTLVKDHMFTPMCCAKWSEVKKATGNPIFTHPSKSGPAASKPPANSNIPVSTPASNPISAPASAPSEPTAAPMTTAAQVEPSE